MKCKTISQFVHTFVKDNQKMGKVAQESFMDKNYFLSTEQAN